MPDGCFDDNDQGMSKGINEIRWCWEHGIYNAKTRKNARNSRIDVKYNATNSSTSRNQMDRVWTHQETRLFTLL
jgi:hypothetical protein